MKSISPFVLIFSIFALAHLSAEEKKPTNPLALQLRGTGGNTTQPAENSSLGIDAGEGLAPKGKPTPGGAIVRRGSTPAPEPSTSKKRSVTITRGVPENIQAASESGAVQVTAVAGDSGISQSPGSPSKEESSFNVSYEVDPTSQVTRQTIHFKVNSTEFAGEATLTEMTFLAEAFRDPILKGHVFVIEGHSSAEGTEHHNLDLSNRRAVAIVAELFARGVDPKQLVPVGYGESEARNPASAPEHLLARDRRVEIYRMVK